MTMLLPLVLCVTAFAQQLAQEHDRNEIDRRYWGWRMDQMRNREDDRRAAEERSAQHSRYQYAQRAIAFVEAFNAVMEAERAGVNSLQKKRAAEKAWDKLINGEGWSK